MTVTPIDPRAYSELLRETLPMVIQSDEQNDRYIAELERLSALKTPSPEQQELAELLTLLIETYEDRAYTLKPVPPVAALKHLMDVNGLRQKDLLDVFRSEGIISEVLSGKREFSKEHIRRLAKRFHVSPELFF